MRSLIPALVFGSILGTAGAASAQMPEHYVGLGVRALFNDDTTAILDSKVKVFNFGGRGRSRTPVRGDVLGNEYSASVRPALYLGSETEYRIPVTFETSASERIYPFIGGGFAYNTDGTEEFNPMLTAGADFRLGGQLILNVEGNFIFQTGDTDSELTASINYEF
ncbi:MAG: hypothetical protein AAFZ80_02365 [Cyanobacteria bacterium P01_A01_bin.105]